MLQIIDIDGFNLKCRLEGQGNENIFVIGSSDYYSRAFSQSLREKLHFAFTDHRGFAQNEHGIQQESCDIPQVLSDMEVVREKIGWDDMVVLGHSGHGFLALEYAKKYGDYVKGIILLNLGPSYSTFEMAKVETRWNELVDPERKLYFDNQMAGLESRIQAHPEQRFLLFMLAMGARSWRDPMVDASNLWAGIPMNLGIIDSLWGKEFRDIDIREGLSDLKAPVFLGMGSLDYLVPGIDSWDPFRNLFPDLTVRCFGGSGHSPMIEQPELFDSELLKWIDAKL